MIPTTVKRNENSALMKTSELCEFLQMGEAKAISVGKAAKARVHVGGCSRWNREKVKAYLANISEGE